MSDTKKFGEPLDDMELGNVVGGARWDEKVEFICKKCKKTVTAVVKPDVCPYCGEKM